MVDSISMKEITQGNMAENMNAAERKTTWKYLGSSSAMADGKF